MAAPVRAAPLSYEQRSAILNEAQQAYDKGAEIVKTKPAEAQKAFRDSAAKFQLLADAGLHNGGLYYNLANAYLQSGQLGRAILNYRRALEYRPADARIANNLSQAREQLKTPVSAPQDPLIFRTLLFWHHGLAWPTRLWIAVGCYVAFWLALLIRLYVRQFPWRFVLAPTLVLALVFGTSAGVQWLQSRTEQDGVILADETTLRKGNGEGFEPQIQQKLGQGVEFRLLEKRGDWFNVRLPDGKEGWVRNTQAELI